MENSISLPVGEQRSTGMDCSFMDHTVKARSFLRERFIRAILAMSGKSAEFSMYENTNVSGEFGSCDREFVNIYVKNLVTPLGPVADALLRTNDIDRIHISDINPSV